MTQLFFPDYCCSMDQIAGDTPEAIDAFRRCNRLGPGQRLLPENFYVIPDNRPGSHSIATQLNLLNPDQRRHLYDCAGQFGELTLAIAIFYDEQLSNNHAPLNRLGGRRRHGGHGSDDRLRDSGPRI